MAGPGKAVANHKCEEYVWQVKGEEDCSEELQEAKESSNEVQSPASLVGMFRDVKGVKLVQGLIILLHQQIYYNKIIIRLEEVEQFNNNPKDRDHTYQAFFFSIFGKSERNWLQM